MWTYTCSVMRAAVLLSALLFVTGLIAQIPSVIALTNLTVVPAYISYLGLIAMLSSPAVLLLAVLISSLPSVNRRLKACQH